MRRKSPPPGPVTVSRPGVETEVRPHEPSGASPALSVLSKLTTEILAGRKRQHRVPAKPGKATPPFRVGATMPVVTSKQVQDETTGDYEPRRVTVCHVKVVSVELEVLSGETMTDRQVRLEGYQRYDEFVDDWWDRYRTGPGRRGGPYNPIEVWVAGFELAESRRYLAAGHVDPLHRPADEHGYERSPSKAIDELEAVDEATQEKIARKGRKDFKDSEPVRLAQRRLDAERRSLPLRLQDALSRAKLAGVDLGPDLRVIEERILKAERKVNREERAA